MRIDPMFFVTGIFLCGVSFITWGLPGLIVMAIAFFVLTRA